MSVRLLPKEPVMLRDTTGQDRVIERAGIWRRHRMLIIFAAAGVIALGVLASFLLRYSGAGSSVDRSRVAIGTVERGSFVRDIATDGQVVAAVSPTLYANSLGTVTLKVHAGDSVSKGQVLAVIDSLDLTAKLSQEEATAVGLRIDCNARASMPGKNCCSCATRSIRRRSIKKPHSANWTAAAKRMSWARIQNCRR